METPKLRNFCIIAHIDHGKSTLADRLLEVTHTVAARDMKAQLLDTMDLERERGITIKLQPVRLDIESDGYVLNLIDTPGHVDFTYEVSRSLAAVEGAVLLVDASQGMQAQTMANLHLALDQNVTIIPAINKIDLPNADVDRVRQEIVQVLGCDPEEIKLVSGKTGQGVPELIATLESEVPPPEGEKNKPLRALIFDSKFDEYRGVVAYVRLVDGMVAAGVDIRFAATGVISEAQEVGVFKPAYAARPDISAGEIGYIVTGLKDVRQCRVGDTILLAADKTTTPLPGYVEVKSMVFAGIFPAVGDEYPLLRQALDRLQLSDAALSFEPEHSSALGFGFRAGFLGLLHLDVTQERLRREYDLEVTVTAPSVAYRVSLRDGSEITVTSPQELPDPSKINHIEEPRVTLDIIVPKEHLGSVMQLVAKKRGDYIGTEYLGERAILHYEIPLVSLLVDFYDKLKSVSAGYASMNYEFAGYRTADVVRLEISVAEEAVEALSMIVYQDEAYERGRSAVTALKEILERQQFEIKIQAAVGGKIIAAERLAPLRKDVTAGLYGGDVTRKQKLLKKQKEGKKRMAAQGRGKVPIPASAYLTILKGTS